MMENRDFKQEFKNRSKLLAKKTLLFVDVLPNKPGARIIANQLGRSAGSVAANYRAACRARSVAEFIAKLGIVEEEADESLMWFELAIECGYADAEVVSPMVQEMNELLAMTISSIKTTRSKGKDSKQSGLRTQESEIP